MLATRNHRIIVAALSVALATAGFVASGSAAFPGTNELLSVRNNGGQGKNISGRFAGPAINEDGQVVAFDSIAGNLVVGDTNKEADVFVRDRSTDTIERASVASDGAQGNDSSSRPAVDGSGDMVVFDSFADNLVAGDANRALDVFVRDRSSGETSLVSVSSNEVQGNGQSHSPSISANGRFVAFVSIADNLVPHDTNGVDDVFVRNLVTGHTRRVNLTSTGAEANSSTTIASISPDGRSVAFSSFASNLVPDDTNDSFDLFVRDLPGGQTERVSVRSNEAQANGSSTWHSLSGDGQLIAFTSNATNLVPGDTNDRDDIFVRDRTAGTTERISVNSNGEQADGNSQDPAVRGLTVSGPDITRSGRFVTFFSSATNLVPGDTNTCPPVFDQTPGRCPDVFVRDRLADTTTRVNLAADGTEANERSSDPVIS